MKAAELFVRCLEHEGVKFLFGLPGEENLDVMDAMLESVRHSENIKLSEKLEKLVCPV